MAQTRAQLNSWPLITRIRRVWREGGLPAIYGCIVARIMRHNSAIWHERALTADLPLPKAEAPVRIIHDDPQATLEWLHRRPHDPRELGLARAEHHLLSRAELNGALVAYVKAGWGEVWISDYQSAVRFPPETAFIYDTYVEPALRRQGIGKALVAAVTRELQARGFARVFCHIPEWNGASRRLYESLGFAARRKIVFARVFGLGILWPRPQVLWHHSASSTERGTSDHKES
jgi:ribosomal protein S18 acetylase RimI-like enzyme